MLGFLTTFIEFFIFFKDIVDFILSIFGEYVPAWITMIMQVVTLCREYCPVELGVVAVICISTMLTRFVYNAVRGSGA